MFNQLMAPLSPLAGLRERCSPFGGVVALIQKLPAWLNKRREKKMEPLNQILEELKALRSDAEDTKAAVATLQCDRLNQAFVNYVDRQKPCPMSVKASLSEMYTQYTRDGKHNHVAKDYLDRLIDLPVEYPVE